jgi:hypothetical protein
MENRGKERSLERAIINSGGQRPPEKDAVFFQSRLKASRVRKTCGLPLFSYFIQIVLCHIPYRNVSLGRNRINHILSLTEQSEGKKARICYQYIVLTGQKAMCLPGTTGTFVGQKKAAGFQYE